MSAGFLFSCTCATWTTPSVLRFPACSKNIYINTDAKFHSHNPVIGHATNKRSWQHCRLGCMYATLTFWTWLSFFSCWFSRFRSLFSLLCLSCCILIWVSVILMKKMIHVLMCAKITQHKCEIHIFSFKLATKILSFKQSERIILYVLTYTEY